MMALPSRFRAIFVFPALFQLEKVSIICLLLLSFSLTAYAQVLPSTPTVYVSGGPTIYMETGSTFTSIFTSPNPNANFESLAIGPDNAFPTDTDANGNAKYAYFLYACDPAGTIIRIAFAPAPTPNPPTFVGTETVYSGSVPGLAPVCGRSSSAGDFYITNKSGSGVFVFSGIANVSFGGFSLLSKPTLVALSPNFSNMTGRGITQKYVGDLLMVDNFDNQVLRSPYATPFAAQKPFITTNLNGPVGIAAAVTTTLNPATGVFVPNSNFFVANSNSTPSRILAAQPPVSVFTFNDATQTGVPAAACPGLNLPGGGPPQVADYLASVPTADAANSVINNTIYLVTNSNNSGSLWTWNTARAQAMPPNCTLTLAASIGKALSGVAVAPAPVTLNLQVSATPATLTATTFNFNSNIFQLTANGCKASVTAYPLSLATVNSMITIAQLPGAGDSNASNNHYPPSLIPPPLPNYPATPLANLGDGGFETVYVAHWTKPAVDTDCTSVFGDNGFLTGIFNFVDSSQYTNPRTIQCDNADATTEPQLFTPTTTTCGSPKTVGVYPLGGPIALDGGTKINSVFAMVKETTGGVPGQFCGFQSPLTGNGTNLPSPPPPLTGNSITVKFKVADLSRGGNCQSGPYLSDTTSPLPTALISVAQICNTTASSDPFCGPNGSPVFNAINVNNNASSSQPALFTAQNNQFKFSLQIGGYASGTYSLTVTFLTNNTTNQTTLFTIP
jgi:hypothetical protein